MIDDPVPAALRIAAVLESLGIDYWLGGSLASSIHGEPRSTHDVDFVVDMTIDDVDRLVRALAAEYFIDPGSTREAVLRRDSFQVVERTGYNRADMFVKKAVPFADEQKRRRRRFVIDADTGSAIWVTSAEDIVLQKLVWYRAGGEVSDRQWRDVLGVLKTTRELDRGHLHRWAQQLDVADLLQRALQEAGIDPHVGP